MLYLVERRIIESKMGNFLSIREEWRHPLSLSLSGLVENSTAFFLGLTDFHYFPPLNFWTIPFWGLGIFFFFNLLRSNWWRCSKIVGEIRWEISYFSIFLTEIFLPIAQRIRFHWTTEYVIITSHQIIHLFFQSHKFSRVLNHCQYFFSRCILSFSYYTKQGKALSFHSYLP